MIVLFPDHTPFSFVCDFLSTLRCKSQVTTKEINCFIGVRRNVRYEFIPITVIHHRVTFVGSRGSSVVDYVLSTQDLFTNLSQFKVHEPNILSDHCLLTFSFAFQMHDVREATDDNFDQVSGRYAWNHEFKTEFLDSLKSAATTERLNELNARIPNCTENGEINQCLTDFNAIIERAACPFYKETKQPPNISEQTNVNKQEAPWFDERCAEKRYYFMRMLDRYRLSNSDVNRIGLVEAGYTKKKQIRI